MHTPKKYMDAAAPLDSVQKKIIWPVFYWEVQAYFLCF